MNIIDKEIFDTATPCKTKPSTSRGRHSGGISIVNSKNGKRIEFSKSILNVLEDPNKVIFLTTDNSLIIKKSDEENAFSIKMMSKKAVIYNAQLTKEITEKFKLDFTNCSCISFSNYSTIKDSTAILMEMKTL